jgi:acyl phosphate:glycerol-3-phosphate acyltransferase
MLFSSIVSVSPDALSGFVIGYLLGSIPFGLLFAYAFGEGDVRKIGSGSIGATNVLRTGSYTAAALTLLFDALKGAAAVAFTRQFLGPDAALFAGLAAFLGHLYPVWLKWPWQRGAPLWRIFASRRCRRWSRPC